MRALPRICLCLALVGCGLDSGEGRAGVGGGGIGGSAGVGGIGGSAGVGGGGGSDACGLPFDVGPCDAAFAVWAFVPQLGACFPHTWGGCGGNDNRFSSRAECEAACPVPEICPTDRVVREICLACGLVGGCPERVVTCPKPCSDTSDCPGTSSAGCFDNVCQAGGCI